MKCCVAYCKSYANKKRDDDIKFYQIPSNLEVRVKWLKNISRRDWIPNDRSVVCSLHFQPDDFRIGLKISKLKPTAVPTIFPNYPKYMQDAALKSCKKRNGPKIRVAPAQKLKNKKQTPTKINSSRSINEDSEIIKDTEQMENVQNNENGNLQNGENLETDINLEIINENNSMNSSCQELLSAIHDHSLLIKPFLPSNETHSNVGINTGISQSHNIIKGDMPKRGRPCMTYNEMKKQLLQYKKKVWQLNKKVASLSQKNKNLKEQLIEKRKYEQNTFSNTKKFCTVFCISADVEEKK